MKWIPLTQGKYAIVDAKNYDSLIKYKWHLLRRRHTCYAGRDIFVNGKRIKILMHREIIGTQHNQDTDHRNHNGLDNRETNLRTCTRKQNLQNGKSKKGSSIYKGVTWSKEKKKWQAQIMSDYKNINLGRYDSEIDAAKAYDKKAKVLCGEFACLNFPT